MSTKRAQKLNRPPDAEKVGNWVWITREMLECPAWQAMTLSARRVLDRLMIEHAAHAGTCNGELVVTFDQFVEAGIRRNSISPAIELLVRLGWVSITRKGGRSRGDAKWPSAYALTWLPVDMSPATNRWKRYAPALVGQTLEGSNASDTGAPGRKPAERRRPGNASDTENTPLSLPGKLDCERPFNEGEAAR